MQTVPATHDPKVFVTGTSVIGLKYKDGVMVASDTNASYGSYAKYKGVTRIFKVAPSCLIASSGEYSNVQNVVHKIDTEVRENRCIEGVDLGPGEIFTMVRRHMYKSRCKGTPEMNFHILAGMGGDDSDEKGRYLGGVNPLGNFYHATVIASGIGAHIVLPILRNKVEGREDEVTKQEAEQIVKECMTVLFYRDTRAASVIQIGSVEAEHAEIGNEITLESKWDIGKEVL